MIALNELIKNIDSYKNIYKSMGVKANLDFIVKLEEQLKNIQLKAEKSRAECNKLCGEIIDLKALNSTADTEILLKKAIELDAKSNKLQAKLEKSTKKINHHLKKLPNIPDLNNLKHIQIETSKTEFNISDFENYLSKHFKTQSSDKTLNNYLKLQANKIFSEEDIPTSIQFKKEILILCSNYDTNQIIDDLINYFKNHSISMIEHSIKKIKKSSCRELFIHLKDNEFLKLEIKREFYTREHKIKYHDNKTDSTKFINQINLIFN